MENLTASSIFGSISSIGTLILVLILWRSGLLKYLLNGKKERNFDDGQSLITIKELADKMTRLECHYNEETTALLQDIKEEIRQHGLKLDRVVENTIWIQAKMNGKKEK
jgi:hypothetical protein